ncbi:carboxypeptidase regulatory-like domain-containing protein [Micromonospora sp. DPT]|uniref:MSCRAMM family protein n=1 Tax=Micromonospora sp. DPT TaxID=3142975 RepID=UPI00320B8067
MNESARRYAAFAAAAVLSLSSGLVASPAYAEEPAPGAITGHVVTEQPGNVTVNLFTIEGASGGQVLSDAEGNFRFASVPVGTYKIQYGFLGRFQWSHQKLGYSTADVVTVDSGATTTVPEETMLLPGIVEVVATDAVTGAPVDTVCAGVQEYSLQCGAVDGHLRLENLESGTYTLQVRSSDGLHARQEVKNVSVTLGRTTRVEVALRPTTAITTTVVDRATGEPVPYACVAALPLVFGALDDDTCRWDVNYTDDRGRVTLRELDPGNYTLLVLPGDDVHGAQWVGRSGGVGRQHDALRIEGQGGQLSIAPTVKLDPAARITGTIRDAETGGPLVNGCASVLPVRQGAGGPPGIGPFCTDSEGVYTVSNLGPYAWPLEFSHFYDYIEPYAAVWSGNAPDRKTAKAVTAGTDQPGVADISLRRTGPRISVTTTSADGQPYNGWLAGEVYNATTGDLVKEYSFYYGPRVIEGLADQPLKLRYVPNPPWTAGWYGGTDRSSADTIRLRNGATSSIRIVLPDPA